MSESILLRTLTEKSILWFGRYNGFSVQKVLELNKTQYLRYLYYNIEGISFCDDVLTKIFIREGDKISKPGKDADLGKAIDDRCFTSIYVKDKFNGTKESVKRVARAKKVYKNQIKRAQKLRAIFESKRNMQSKNHGH